MKLLASNLPDYMTSHDLKQLFETVGRVKNVEVVAERHSAFGRVEMEDEKAGKKAISFLNGLEMDGGLIVVELDEGLLPRR